MNQKTLFIKAIYLLCCFTCIKNAVAQNQSPPLTNTSEPFTILFTADINGHIYFDYNGNGQQDMGEPNIANVNIIIYMSNGSLPGGNN